jgi:hypothetical protein
MTIFKTENDVSDGKKLEKRFDEITPIMGTESNEGVWTKLRCKEIHSFCSLSYAVYFVG